MTARLISSVIWVGILLIPAIRVLLTNLAVLLWPNKGVLSSLGGSSAPLIPTVGLVAVGYAMTVVLFGRFLLPRLNATRSLESSGEKVEGGRAGFPVALALLITALWLVLLGINDLLTPFHLIIAGLILLGLMDVRRPQPIPQPDPGPGPEPTDDEDYPEDSEDDENYYRVYEWLFDEEPYRRSGNTHKLKMSLKIPKVIYEDFLNRSHDVSRNSDYVRFINEELDDEVVTSMVAKLRQIVDAKGFDKLTEIHLAMAFTLSFSYAFDDGEYPKYPVETLVDRNGDCEDHANLCGAALHGLGHFVTLVLMDIDERSGHAALAVESPVSIPGVSFTDSETGRKLFYCEVTPALDATTRQTTNVQWWLGRDPMSEAHNFTLWAIG